MMIKTAIRLGNNMVMVFDEEGEQIPEYQGYYEEVKESVLMDAPLDAAFTHDLINASELQKVLREEW